LHPEHRAEVEDLVSVGDLLALAPEELEPPASLRSSIMATVKAESRESAAASRQRSRQSIWERVGGFARFGRIAVGAAAILLIGVLSWNSFVQRGEIQDLRSAAESRQAAAQAQGSSIESIRLEGAATGKVEVVKLDGEQAVLVAEGLTPIDKGKTLQIWVIEDDVPKPSGIFDPGDKLRSVAVEHSLKNADMLAVTVEPAGGSKAPTTDPVMVAKL
ncbi:MAG: anti-sigma factor, partial [Actinomycetota bacterium]|nr:anti-sigma factor [Actinomycetota bacterium]